MSSCGLHGNGIEPRVCTTGSSPYSTPVKVSSRRILEVTPIITSFFHTGPYVLFSTEVVHTHNIILGLKYSTNNLRNSEILFTTQYLHIHLEKCLAWILIYTSSCTPIFILRQAYLHKAKTLRTTFLPFLSVAQCFLYVMHTQTHALTLGLLKFRL